MDIYNFWKRVNVLIADHNTNDEKFAVYIGIPVKIFRSWNLNNRVPDMISISMIAASLNVPMDYLITGNKNSSETVRFIKPTMKQAISKVLVEKEQENSDYDQPGAKKLRFLKYPNRYSGAFRGAIQGTK